MLERAYSSKFRAELQEVLDDTGSVYLIQDAPKSGKKPYDAYFIWRGWHVSIEFKVAKGASVSYKCVTHNQKVALLKDEKAGGLSFIIVLIERQQKSLIITVDAWEKLFEEGEQSLVKIDVLEQACLRLPVFYPEDRPMVIDRHKWFPTKNDKGKDIVATRWFFPEWLKFMDSSCKRYDYAL